jgi:hypothetical protein
MGRWLQDTLDVPLIIMLTDGKFPPLSKACISYAYSVDR